MSILMGAERRLEGIGENLMYSSEFQLRNFQLELGVYIQEREQTRTSVRNRAE